MDLTGLYHVPYLANVILPYKCYCFACCLEIVLTDLYYAICLMICLSSYELCEIGLSSNTAKISKAQIT